MKDGEMERWRDAVSEYHSENLAGGTPDPDVSLVGPSDDEGTTGRGRSIDINCVNKARMTT